MLFLSGYQKYYKVFLNDKAFIISNLYECVFLSLAFESNVNGKPSKYTCVNTREKNIINK